MSNTKTRNEGKRKSKKRGRPNKDNEDVLTLKARIVKPMNETWDRFGDVLLALSMPLHRVTNNAVTRLELDATLTPGIQFETHAYKLAGTMWSFEREASAERVSVDQNKLDVATKKLATAERSKIKQNKLAAAISQLDTADGAEQSEEIEERIKRIEKRILKAQRQISECNRRLRLNSLIADTSPSSSVVLAASKNIFKLWKKWDKDRWGGNSVLSKVRSPQPIGVGNSNNTIKIKQADNLAVISVPLLSGRKDNRFELLIQPSGGSAFWQLAQILKDPTRMGSISIERSRKQGKKGKRPWMVNIHWSQDKEKPLSGRTMALHRGVNTFLTAAIAREGKAEAQTIVIATGEDILYHKRAYSARGRALRKHGRELGKGAKGHGVRRRYERLETLKKKESLWVRTKCQQVAARTVKIAKQRGVSTILIENWGNPATDADVTKNQNGTINEYVERMIRNFPLAQLKATIKRCAAQKGIEVIEVNAAYQSRRCPHCNHMHEAPPLRRDRNNHLSVFCCESCKLERPVDNIAVWNMLDENGYELPLVDAINAEKRTAGRLKK